VAVVAEKEAERVAVVIEDDLDIRDLLKVILEQSGFEVHVAATGAEGVETVRERRPAVVTVDLGLPDFDGFEVIRRLRLISQAYILMVTARADEVDTLMGLEFGADDYMTKPFRPRELRARITAMMRRPRDGADNSAPAAAENGAASAESTAAQQQPVAQATAPTQGTASAPASVPTQPGGYQYRGKSPARPAVQPGAAARPGTAARPGGTDRPGAAGGSSAAAAGGFRTANRQEPEPRASRYEHNGLELDAASRVVGVPEGEIELTRTEFDLLHALLQGGRRVRSRAELVRALRFEEYDTGAYTSEADERAIEVHMANIRRKLGDNPRSPRWVETVRGVGYRLTPAQRA
jgi:two-component system OmpR family response regulator